MSDYKYYITVSSWEDRSWMSSENLLSEYSCENSITFYSNEFIEHTAKTTKTINFFAIKNKSTAKSHSFHASDQPKSWNEFKKNLDEVNNCKVLFDISTSPREVIWYILHFLNINRCLVDIKYSRPEHYGEWLSKDPEKPRLIYNHSGITNLERPTALLLISGFDIERADQLIRYFEPKITFLALQSGTQYNNHKKNIDAHLEALNSSYEVQPFYFNSFSSDGGHSEIRGEICNEVDNYNIISTSLGPKPSTVALFKLQQEFPQIALCYIPSAKYNTGNYSSGINETISIDY